MSVSIELVDQASIRLEKLTEEIRGRLRVTMARDAKDLASLVRSNISGPILHVKTGALLASIRDELYETPDAIWARVYSDDKKAAILEWGGHTKPHMIYPVNRAGAPLHCPGSHRGLRQQGQPPRLAHPRVRLYLDEPRPAKRSHHFRHARGCCSMTATREAISAALFTQLQTAGTVFRTYSRTWKSVWDDPSGAVVDLPLLVQFEQRETVQWGNRGIGPIRRWGRS